MAFWLIAGVIAALVGASIALGLMRPRGDRASDASDIAVYRDQLREVERDISRGTLDTDEAKRVRVEILRRLLAADKRQAEVIVANQRVNVWLAAGLAAALLGAGGLIYMRIGAPGYADMPHSERLATAEAFRASRPGQGEIEAELDAARSDPVASADDRALIARLQAALASRPQDLEGHIQLATSAAQIGDFAAAHVAQARVLELIGVTATAADWASYTDMLVLAAGGYVSPEAEVALRAALALDAANGTARYYAGLMFAQTGRPDRTVEFWRPLYASSPADAPWMAVIGEHFDAMAADAGMRISLPERARGPSAADVEGATELGLQDRMIMIEGMVAGLAERLASEGGSAAEWAQLIRSLGVLGRAQEAAAIWAEAQVVFADDVGALAEIDGAARAAGLGQ